MSLYYHSPHSSHHIHEVTYGVGAPVALVHGIGASLRDWNHLAPRLVEAGYRVHALDLPGHGDSHKPDAAHAYTPHALYESFEGWLEKISAGAPLRIVAHSMGGYLSLNYALHHPGCIARLVLINPLFSPNQLSPFIRALRRRPELSVHAMRMIPVHWIERAMRLEPTQAALLPPELRQRIAMDFKRASPNIIYFARDLPDLQPRLAQVDTPALVIWGDRDLTLHPRSFPRLIESLPAASGERLARVGHLPHLTRPEVVSRQVLDFLHG